MGYLIQKKAASGKVITFDSPTQADSLIILAISWTENPPVAGYQLFFRNSPQAVPDTNTVDSGGNTYFQTINPTINGNILASVATNPLQTITLDPHYWAIAVDHGVASPAGLRVRAYEVSNCPGPSGHHPEGTTNVQTNGCCGAGETTPGNPQAPSGAPSYTLPAADWSDFIGDNAFYVFLLTPDGGSSGFTGTVSAVDSSYVLDDVQGPTAVAYLDGGSADADQTPTFTWSSPDSWAITATAWEAFGSAPPPPPPPPTPPPPGPLPGPCAKFNLQKLILTAREAVVPVRGRNK